MGQTGFCENLRFPAVFCENLRFPAVFCENLRLRNAIIPRKSENLQKSAKICEKTANSARFVPFSLSLLLPLKHSMIQRCFSRASSKNSGKTKISFEAWNSLKRSLGQRWFSSSKLLSAHTRTETSTDFRAGAPWLAAMGTCQVRLGTFRVGFWLKLTVAPRIYVAIYIYEWRRKLFYLNSCQSRFSGVHLVL